MMNKLNSINLITNILVKLLFLKGVIIKYKKKSSFDDFYTLTSIKFNNLFKKRNIDLSSEIIKITKTVYTIIFINPANDCLYKSMCFHFILNSFGIENTFYIGIKRFPFLSHAWVEDNIGNILTSYEHECRELTIIKSISFKG